MDALGLGITMAMGSNLKPFASCSLNREVSNYGIGFQLAIIHVAHAWKNLNNAANSLSTDKTYIITPHMLNSIAILAQGYVITANTTVSTASCHQCASITSTDTITINLSTGAGLSGSVILFK